jgi:hypothetical protein
MKEKYMQGEAVSEASTRKAETKKRCINVIMHFARLI